MFKLHVMWKGLPRYVGEPTQCECVTRCEHDLLWRGGGGYHHEMVLTVFSLGFSFIFFSLFFKI